MEYILSYSISYLKITAVCGYVLGDWAQVHIFIEKKLNDLNRL